MAKSEFIPIEDLFLHIPETVGQYSAVLTIAGTAWEVLGDITVFNKNAVRYSQDINGQLVDTKYIPTHFVLIGDIPNITNKKPNVIRQNFSYRGLKPTL